MEDKLILVICGPPELYNTSLYAYRDQRIKGEGSENQRGS